MGTNKQPAAPAALNKVAAAMLCPESDVSKPARTRSASFASVIADLLVGGDPAAKTLRIDPSFTIEQVTAWKPDLSEKLRNTVQSSVNQAKRRVPGAQYSIEIIDGQCKSGVYLIALVSRNT